jgi:hypothetical protein
MADDCIGPQVTDAIDSLKAENNAFGNVRFLTRKKNMMWTSRNNWLRWAIIC